MTHKQITISIPGGLTSKTAIALIEKANEFPYSIVFDSNDRRANGKSLLGMLSLGLRHGDSVLLSTNGEKEEAAAEALSAIL